ncbi:hypothetical protein Bbelb_281880 [Branchiostoma belcheri]|nr:hypothetical protein Bbelb_281880 [Branchiostoma belcheri]
MGAKINSDNVIILGDFNIPGIKWDTTVADNSQAYTGQAEKLLNLMDNHGLFQTVQEPTKNDGDVNREGDTDVDPNYKMAETQDQDLTSKEVGDEKSPDVEQNYDMAGLGDQDLTSEVRRSRGNGSGAMEEYREDFAFEESIENEAVCQIRKQIYGKRTVKVIKHLSLLQQDFCTRLALRAVRTEDSRHHCN